MRDFLGDFAALDFVIFPKINEVSFERRRGKDQEERERRGKERHDDETKKKSGDSVNRSLDLERLPNKQARSEAISRAIRIIVNEAHYPTYSFPSCHSY